MTTKKPRLLTSLALLALLLLPAGAVAQDDSAASPAAGATAVAEDPRFAELEALMPAALAGLPLVDNLALATGERLFGMMRPEESAILQGLLDEHGKTVADYAAASTWLQISATEVVVIQAHRIAGIDASGTIDAWVDVLTINLADPQVSEGFIAGRPVTLVSGGFAPEVPPLHLFPAGDVMWMVVAADGTLVEEAMAAVGADGVVTTEAPPGTAAPPEPEA